MGAANLRRHDPELHWFCCARRSIDVSLIWDNSVINHSGSRHKPMLLTTAIRNYLFLFRKSFSENLLRRMTKTKALELVKITKFLSSPELSSSYLSRSHLVPCWSNAMRVFWSVASSPVSLVSRFSSHTLPRSSSWCASKRRLFWFSASPSSSWHCAVNCFGWFC